MRRWSLSCMCLQIKGNRRTFSGAQQTCLQGWPGILKHGGRVMIKTGVTLAGVELKNPVMTASGTFGSGAEYSEFVDLNRLGAVVTKGVANVPWPGNPTPRVTETASGMLNAIGLQNPGIDLFCKRDIPFLKQYDTKIVVNVCGKSTEDYCEVVERLTSLRSMFPARMSKKVELLLDRTRKLWKRSLRKLRSMQNSRSS